MGVIAACGSGKDPNSGGGPSPCMAGNGQNMGNRCGGSPGTAAPTPPPTSTPGPAQIHAPDITYIGNALGGSSTYVTQALIQQWATIAMDPAVGAGAGRAVNVSDHGVHTLSEKYFDWNRPAIGGNNYGAWITADPGFLEGVVATNTLLHKGLPTNSLNRTGTNFYNTNFANAATEAQWKGCITGTASASSNSPTCNATSPPTGDSQSGLSLDSNDIAFGDTDSVTIATLTQNTPPPTTTAEIGSDALLLADMQAWYPLTFLHANGTTPYKVMLNGANRGINQKTNNGTGSCGTSAQGRNNCTDLCSLATVVQWCVLEFFGQALPDGSHEQFTGGLFPGYVNSATAVLATGRSVVELEEYESCYPGQGAQCSNGTGFNPKAIIIGTTPNRMLAYYVAYLLTYNPANPGSTISMLDLDGHNCCSDPSTVPTPMPTENANRMSIWPVQSVVPATNPAIGVTTYNAGNATAPVNPGVGICTQGVNCYGIDGCLNGTDPTGESDSGGIIPYLVPLSCGTANSGSATLKIGVYANAWAHCTVSGVDIGACMGVLNLTNANFTIPCSLVGSLGTLLGNNWALLPAVIFNHQIDIGQGSTGAVFADVIPVDTSGISGNGGGTLTYNSMTFQCGIGSGVVGPDSGLIATP